MFKSKNLSGAVFGRLTALKHADRKCCRVHWLCVCECGNFCEVLTARLLSGQTKSCGCLILEHSYLNIRRAHTKEARDNYDKSIGAFDGTAASLLTQKTRTNNTSGTKGVSFNKKSGTWLAYINFKGTRHNLGLHKTKESAIAARKKAEQLYFAPFLKEVGRAESTTSLYAQKALL